MEMNIHFITFANTQSNFSLDRIKYEAELMNIFNSITGYTENDIDKEYLKKYGDHFKYPRGYGYWCWKPYIIKKKLSEIKDGDIIIYADCGCTLNPNNINKLLSWINIVSNSNSGILCPHIGLYPEHRWTRMDLYLYINKTYNKENINIFEGTSQYEASVILLLKTPKSIEFINIWNDIMTEHFDLCTDTKSTIPNHPKFKENRHDQSVFSLLGKIFKIETIYYLEGNASKDSPILVTRIKNDKLTWTPNG